MTCNKMAALVNDLVEIIAYYTTPLETINLITIDATVAGRVSYSDRLWKQKLIVERKGLIYDEPVAQRGDWYMTYRVVCRRFSGGKVYFVTASTAAATTHIADDALEVAESNSTDFLILIDNKIIGCAFRGHRKPVAIGELRKSRDIESLTRTSRDGYTLYDTTYGPNYDTVREQCIEYHGSTALMRDGSVISYYEIVAKGIVGITSRFHYSILLSRDSQGSQIKWFETNVSHLITNDILPTYTVPKGGISHERATTGKYLNVYVSGTANIITLSDWVGTSVSGTTDIALSFTSDNAFPETPRIIRAVWGHTTGEVLVLDPAGNIHLYNMNRKHPYKGVVLTGCVELVQIGSHYVYVTV